MPSSHAYDSLEERTYCANDLDGTNCQGRDQQPTLSIHQPGTDQATDENMGHRFVAALRADRMRRHEWPRGSNPDGGNDNEQFHLLADSDESPR